MGDAIQSFLDTYDPGATDSIPQQPPACCCGNDSCAYLRHNVSSLEQLEVEVRKASRIGQALLLRHEAYIADSERERRAMTEQIECLETEKGVLERRNATVIADNRDLLDQLEAVNNAVSESDAHVTSLQATLQSTQLQLQKLAKLAARTDQLERQLLEYEQEQAAWDASLEAKDQSERTAVRRWQQAERTLAGMQEQIERIEREAREERERHVEVVGRMERRYAVETELTTAAGRLKGAAATKTPLRDPGGTSVVLHFVKDILQDNANLQMGIVELREMLQNSNDEVETLRRHMEDHQPAAVEAEPVTAEVAKRKDLGAEMRSASSQELHVHHHYHAPTPTATKTPTVRRAKKKRYGVLTPGHFTPPSSGLSTPRSSVSYGTPSSATNIMQQTSASIPQSIPPDKRHSSSSSHAHSTLSTSGPASPQSTTNRTSSLFDRVFSDAGHDESSRPTTPGSEDAGSPLLAPVDAKRGAPGLPWRTSSAPVVHRRGISPGAGRASLESMMGMSFDDDDALLSQTTSHDAIPEESEGEWEDDSRRLGEDNSLLTSPISDDLTQTIHIRDDSTVYRPPLRRAASHESLMSISGMDIHTLKTRPSQLLAGPTGRPLAARAELSNALAHTARTTATLSRPAGNSGRALLSGMAAEQRVAGKSSLGFGGK
ncbi:hypothetical protein LTR53_013590, partial [Teratosphaeriaceae sp. CCFEE 6253]